MQRNDKVAYLVFAAIVFAAIIFAIGAMIRPAHAQSNPGDAGYIEGQGVSPRPDGGAGQAIVGPARIVDGDTLVVNDGPFGEIRIRLAGIDAPEAKQQCGGADGKPYPCGEVSTVFLAAKIDDHPVTCIASGEDRYKRTLAICYVGMVELNRWMVMQGFAVDYRRYSNAYIAEEDAARAAHLGIWQGPFVMPWDWRKAQRRKPATPPAPGVAPRTEDQGI